MVCTEQRLAELVDYPGPAELRERILGGPRRHERAVRKLVARPVVIRDDHLEAASLRLRDLPDRGDAAVDREHEPDAVVGELLERVMRDAVPFLEAARQMPHRVRADLAQDQDRERSRADSVDVVVAVDTDLPPVRDGLLNSL